MQQPAVLANGLLDKRSRCVCVSVRGWSGDGATCQAILNMAVCCGVGAPMLWCMAVTALAVGPKLVT